MAAPIPAGFAGNGATGRRKILIETGKKTTPFGARKKTRVSRIIGTKRSPLNNSLQKQTCQRAVVGKARHKQLDLRRLAIHASASRNDSRYPSSAFLNNSNGPSGD